MNMNFSLAFEAEGAGVHARETVFGTTNESRGRDEGIH